MELLKFDLQAFADANVNTTNDNTTGNNLSAEMKTYYDRRCLKMPSISLYMRSLARNGTFPPMRAKPFSSGE